MSNIEVSKYKLSLVDAGKKQRERESKGKEDRREGKEAESKS